ncbi:Transcriptional regulator, LysR family protein [Cupriavidus taiwanensis]|uniref:Transcriptional regulator, LysR family protein n=1 Tax=Cupriavidus taiwanensis TaxID=164546 RepID=A0A975XB02_9BURK|nr:LysR family transcriptional regulator [Cupriavidus taiwanensis]SOY64209.1 Transcriptional regulator, LysR family protein [Cupriavidus taiwanensis]
MHAKSIRYFEAIARAGSIREAARKLHVDASAVNRQLLNLEDELGAALFDRLPTGLRLTEAGQLFSRHVLHVLQDEQCLLAELAKLQGVERGEVRVTAVEALNADFLPAVIETMARRHPKIRLTLRTQGSADIAAGLLAGDADVGIAFALAPHSDLQTVDSAEFRLGAVMAPSHPLARRRQVTVAECMAYPLILASPELALHSLFTPLLAGMEPAQPPIHTGSLDLMRQLAMRGIGIAFQTRIGLAGLCRAQTLAYVPLADKAPTAPMAIHVRAGRTLPPAVGAFLVIACDELRQLRQEEAGAAAV